MAARPHCDFACAHGSSIQLHSLTFCLAPIPLPRRTSILHSPYHHHHYSSAILDAGTSSLCSTPSPRSLHTRSLHRCGSARASTRSPLTVPDSCLPREETPPPTPFLLPPARLLAWTVLYDAHNLPDCLDNLLGALPLSRSVCQGSSVTMKTIPSVSFLLGLKILHSLLQNLTSLHTNYANRLAFIPLLCYQIYTLSILTFAARRLEYGWRCCRGTCTCKTRAVHYAAPFLEKEKSWRILRSCGSQSRAIIPDITSRHERHCDHARRHDFSISDRIVPKCSHNRPAALPYKT